MTEDPAPNYGNGLFGTGQAEGGGQRTVDRRQWTDDPALSAGQGFELLKCQDARPIQKCES